MTLANGFLALVRKATTDLDIDRLHEEVRAFAGRHPEWTTRRKADWLIGRTARRESGGLFAFCR